MEVWKPALISCMRFFSDKIVDLNEVKDTKFVKNVLLELSPEWDCSFRWKDLLDFLRSEYPNFDVADNNDQDIVILLSLLLLHGMVLKPCEQLQKHASNLENSQQTLVMEFLQSTLNLNQDVTYDEIHRAISSLSFEQGKTAEVLSPEVSVSFRSSSATPLRDFLNSPAARRARRDRRAEVERLREELFEERNENENLRQENDSLKQNIKSLGDRLLERKNEVAALTEELDIAHKETENRRKEEKKLEDKVTLNETKIKELLKVMEKMQEESDDRKKQLYMKDNQLSVVEKEKEKLQSMMIFNDQLLENLRQKADEALGENKILKERCSLLQRQLEEAECTPPWSKCSTMTRESAGDNLASELELAEAQDLKKKLNLMSEEMETLQKNLEESQTMYNVQLQTSKDLEKQLATLGVDYRNAVKDFATELQAALDQKEKLRDSYDELQTRINEVKALSQEKDCTLRIQRTQFESEKSQLENRIKMYEDEKTSLSAKISKLGTEFDSLQQEKDRIIRERDAGILEKDKIILEKCKLIDEKDRTISDKQTKLSEISSLVDEKHGVIDKLRAEISETSILMEDYVRTINELEAKVSEMAQVIDEKNADVEGKKSVIEKISAGIAAKDNVIEALKAEITEKTNIVEKKEAEIAEKTAIIKEKEAEIAEMTTTIKKKEAEIAEKIHTIEEKETEIADMTTTIKEKEAEIAEMTTTIKKKEAEIAEKINTIKEKEAEIAEKIHTIKEKETEIADMTTTIKEKEAEIAEKINTIKEKEAEIAEMTTTIKEKEAEMTTTIKEKEAEIAEMTTTIKKKEAEIADMTTTIKEKEAEIAEKINTVKEKEAGIAEMTTTIKEKEAEIAEKINTIKEKEAEIAEKINTIKEKEAGIAEMTTTIKEKEAEIAEMTTTIKKKKVEIAEKINTISEKEGEILEKDRTILEKCKMVEEKDRVISDKETKLFETCSIVEEKNGVIDKLRSEISETNCVMTKKATLMEELEVKIAEMGKVINENIADIEGKNRVIQKMGAEIAAKDTVINAQKAEITRKADTINEREAEIVQKSAVIKEKESVIAEKTTSIEEKETVIAENATIIREKEAKLSEKERIVNEMKEIISQRETEIGEKEKRIADLKKELEEVKIELEESTDAQAMMFSELNTITSLKTRADLELKKLLQERAQLDILLSLAISKKGNAPGAQEETCNSLTARLQLLCDELKSLEQINSQNSESMKALSSRNHGKLNEILEEKIALEKSNKELASAIEKMNLVVQEYDKQVQDLQKIVAEKDVFIVQHADEKEKLQDSLREIEREMEGARSIRCDLESEVETLRQKVQNMEAAVSNSEAIEKALETANSARHDLESEVASLREKMQDLETYKSSNEEKIHSFLEKEKARSELQTSLDSVIKQQKTEVQNHLARLRSWLDRVTNSCDSLTRTLPGTCTAVCEVISTKRDIEQMLRSVDDKYINCLNSTIRCSDDILKLTANCDGATDDVPDDKEQLKSDLNAVRSLMTELVGDVRDVISRCKFLVDRCEFFMDEQARQVVKVKTTLSKDSPDNPVKSELEEKSKAKSPDSINDVIGKVKTEVEDWSNVDQHTLSEGEAEKKLQTLQNAHKELQASHKALEAKLQELQQNSSSKSDETIQLLHKHYAAKLETLKLKMNQICTAEIDKEKLKREQSEIEIRAHYEKRIAEYTDHVQSLSSQLWKLGEKLLQVEQEKKALQDKLLSLCDDKYASLPNVARHSLSVDWIDRVGQEEVPLMNRTKPDRQSLCERKRLDAPAKPKRAQLTSSAMSRIEEALPTQQRPANTSSSAVMAPASMGVAFPEEDEDGELFNNTYLADMKAGRTRLTEFQQRNSMCPPHLKSCYPGETQFHDPKLFNEDDIKINDSRRATKDRTQTSYKRPGPPTPSKNGRRLSLQGKEESKQMTPRGYLQEPNRQSSGSLMNILRTGKTTPSRLKGWFTSSKVGAMQGTKTPPPVKSDENDAPLTPTSKRRSIFKKKFGREPPPGSNFASFR